MMAPLLHRAAIKNIMSASATQGGHNCYKRSFMIVYADDILLIALTVSSLEFLLRACETVAIFRREH